MEFTGERMIPEFNKGNELYVEHIARYMFASQFIKDRIVLDIACGSGYGSDYLSRSGAKKVVGVDISKETIDYCNERYKDDNLSFILGSATKIPSENNSVDIIISFETIEHIGEEEQKVFMQEIKRVLKKDGILIMSTPNSLVYPPGNPFHIKELTRDAFSQLLKKSFQNVSILLQENVESSFILSKDVLSDDNISNIYNEGIFGGKIGKINPDDITYFVAVCSDGKVSSKGIVSMSQEVSRNMHIAIVGDRDNKIKNIQERIENMESSKFWKLRNHYIYIKNGISFAFHSPLKFIKKYLKI